MRHLARFTAYALMVCGTTALHAAMDSRVLPQGKTPDDHRLGSLRNLNGYFPFVPPSTREAWQERAADVRRQVLVAAGLWPMPVKTPRHAVIHGRIDRGDYTVEKVYFESYPGFFVTGNLYRPKGRAGKLAAVLCPHGHWPNGRFHDTGAKEIREQIVAGAERFALSGRHPLQARCMQLARMGCVVFHYDMVGYADSKQLEHRSGERAEMDGPRHWGFFSPQAEARLQTIFGLQTYDSICALDFLCDLPDVDPTRIAVTGASGGGTQTMMICAIDPRPAVSFPVVMVSTAMQGGCPCENASYLRIGTGNIELAALFAPKPLGMTAADDWTKEIATKGLPELKRLYEILGAKDLVMAKPLVHFPHNYNYVSRAVMYQWLNRHLRLGLEEPIVEEDFAPLSIAEMSVWDAQHPAPLGGAKFERGLLERMAKSSDEQIKTLRPHDRHSLAEYRRVVGGAVKVMIGRGVPPLDALSVRDRQPRSLGSTSMVKFLLRYSDQAEEVPTVLLQPSAWNRRVVIWVDAQGKQGLWNGSELRPGVQSLLGKGFAVLAADLLGQGEYCADGRPWAKARLSNFSAERRNRDPWVSYAGYTFGYNSPLFSERVQDILALIAFARSPELEVSAVDVVGVHGAGHWVAAARAIAGGAIHRAAIDTAAFRFAKLTALDDPDFLPGGTKYGDLPGVMALSAPEPLWLAGEDAAGTSIIAAAYEAAGRSENLVISPVKDDQTEAAIVSWLTAGR